MGNRPENIRCDNCIYFDANMGECHRHPPANNSLEYGLMDALSTIYWAVSGHINAEDRLRDYKNIDPDTAMMSAHGFPTSEPEDWCGEFRAGW